MERKKRGREEKRREKGEGGGDSENHFLNQARTAQLVQTYPPSFPFIPCSSHVPLPPSFPNPFSVPSCAHPLTLHASSCEVYLGHTPICITYIWTEVASLQCISLTQTFNSVEDKCPSPTPKWLQQGTPAKRDVKQNIDRLFKELSQNVLTEIHREFTGDETCFPVELNVFCFNVCGQYGILARSLE